MSLKDEAIDKNSVPCPTCGGVSPCRGCSDYAEDSGVYRKGDTLAVVLPVGADKDMGSSMLEIRGYDPTEWEESTLTVNDWDSQIAGGGRMTMHQTKITYRKVLKLEDTAIGQYMAWVETREKPEFTSLPTLPTLKGISSPKRILAIGDHQAPYVDKQLHELTCEMLSDIKVDGILYMGDGPDFDSISRHRKKQGTDFISTVQNGVDSMHTILGELKQASGAEENLYYLIGNHDVRIQTIITEKIPDLFGVKRANMPDEEPVLSIPHLLRLGELGFETVTDSKGDYPHGRVVLSEGNEEIPPLIASHGWIATKGAGNSARGSIQHLNASIIVGHTHRLALSHVTRWTETNQGQEPRVYSAVETGAMCDGEGLGYSKYPDWQPGFAVVDLHKNGDYDISLATKRGSSLKWGGMMWTRTAKGVRRT